MDFNYGEYVFQQLITIDFVQQKLAFILIAICVNIIQIHVVSVLSYMVSIHPYLDFFTQITVSVICTLNIRITYNIVERYRKEFTELTQYLINNYSIDNYRMWKRMVILSLCGYGLLLLMFIQITNRLIIMCIIQYVISFIIIEQFEQKRIQKWIRDYQQRPVTKQFETDTSENLLIQSYISPKRRVFEYRKSVLPQTGRRPSSEGLRKRDSRSGSIESDPRHQKEDLNNSIYRRNLSNSRERQTETRFNQGLVSSLDDQNSSYNRGFVKTVGEKKNRGFIEPIRYT